MVLFPDQKQNSLNYREEDVRFYWLIRQHATFSVSVRKRAVLTKFEQRVKISQN